MKKIWQWLNKPFSKKSIAIFFFFVFSNGYFEYYWRGDKRMLEEHEPLKDAVWLTVIVWIVFEIVLSEYQRRKRKKAEKQMPIESVPTEITTPSGNKFQLSDQSTTPLDNPDLKLKTQKILNRWVYALVAILLVLILVAVIVRKSKTDETTFHFNEPNMLSAEAFYDELRSNPKIKGLPSTYNEFQTKVLENPVNLKILYDGLLQNPTVKNLPNSFEDFQKLYGQAHNLRALYDKLQVNPTIELSDFNTFQNKYGNEKGFIKLYGELQKNPTLDLPDFETFKTKYMPTQLQPNAIDTSTTALKLEFDLQNGRSQIFDFKDSENFFGTNLTIKYPTRMRSVPGDKKRTIRKIAILDEDRSEFRCIINFQPIQIRSSSLAEKKSALSTEAMRRNINQIGAYLNKFEILDIEEGLLVATEPASYGEYYCENLKTDGADRVNSICRMYSFFYSGGVGTVQFYLDSKKLNKPQLIQKFETYKQVINRMVNSLELY